MFNTKLKLSTSPTSLYKIDVKYYTNAFSLTIITLYFQNEGILWNSWDLKKTILTKHKSAVCENQKYQSTLEFLAFFVCLKQKVWWNVFLICVASASTFSNSALTSMLNLNILCYCSMIKGLGIATWKKTEASRASGLIYSSCSLPSCQNLRTYVVKASEKKSLTWTWIQYSEDMN